MKKIITKEQIRSTQADRLKQARILAGLRARADVKQFGWNVNGYTAHERGERQFDEEAAQRYATAFKVEAGWLLAHDLVDHAKPSSAVQVQTVPVHGRAAGGVWLEADAVAFPEDFAEVPACAGFPAHVQYARKVVGNSVSNRVRDGDYAICVKVDHYPGDIRDGSLVDVMRERSGIYEHTVKAKQGNRLLTDSAELDEQVAIDLNHADNGTIVSIVGVVIGAFRPL